MEFAMWAYPWDLRDRGIKTGAAQLDEIGIDEVNLATNYHSVHSFSPDNTDQRSYFAKASAYFQPSEEYGKLAPIPAEQMGDADWTKEVVEGFAKTDISINSWTVGCHNSRLGLRHPELTITSPYGDSLAFGLCPSQPAVQSYLTTMIRDLDGRDAFDRIELEVFDYFHGSGFGWHHDKSFVNLGELGEFLIGLCFCAECRTNAVNAGIDVDQVRRECIAALDTLSTQRGSQTLDPHEWVCDHPEVEAYMKVREKTVTNLFAELRSITNSELGYYIGLLEIDKEWMFGVDLDAIADYVDYYTVTAYESTSEEVRDTFEVANELTSEIPVHVGIQPGPPIVNDGEIVQKIVDEVIEAGTERVSFYNYGPLPERSLSWIANATQRHD